VQGARENNLKDVSVEIPKRRLTVFTGVSGSGKSSLVFGTIAAESQRLINETYSAFVQGFMPTLARPDVDVLDGADHGDHRRPGADGRQRPLHRRHRHRRQRDAADPVQPARQAAHRLAQRVLVQRRLGRGAGAITVEKGGARQDREARSSAGRRHVPALRGHGLGHRHRPHAALRRDKSLNEGALTIPGYSMDGWYGRIFRGCGFFDPDKPIRKFTKKELTTCSTRSRPRSRSTASTSPTRG
jgi:energy-coupling factor transporter ATP-binding protein EcfA2